MRPPRWLAELGSVTSACKRVAMASFGAYALRRAEGAESFRAAWKQALDMGVQRLADIALDRAIDGVAVPIMDHGEQVGERRHYNDRLLTFMLQHHQPGTYGGGRLHPGIRSAKLDELEDEDAQREHGETQERIRDRLTRARRLLLAGISGSPDKRAAWEVLVGPVDWAKAERLEPQADEPFGDGMYSMRKADMLMTAEAGLIAEFTGGPDSLAEIAQAVEELRAAEAELPAEEKEALDVYRAGLIADGWVEDEQGNLWSPESDA